MLKRPKLINQLFLILLTPFIIRCMSSGAGTELKKEVFHLQSRLIELEGQVDKGGKKNKSIGKDTNIRIASTAAKIDSINQSLLALNGQLDTMRFAIRTGELPGTSSKEESIAKIINRVHERLSAIEQTQALILRKLDQKTKKRVRKPLGTLSQVKNAFNQKRYSHIKSDAPLLFSKFKGKNLLDLKYYYADSLFKLGQLSDAALAFNSLLKESSLQDRHPQIQMRLGDAFRLLGDTEVAYVYYSELVEKFPKSELVPEAEEQSKALEGKINP